MTRRENSRHRAILTAADYPTFAGLLRDSGCRRCTLAEGRTHIVVDRGDPRAGVLLVGEAPGRQEDLAGRAFVGRAGRLLDELLRAAGFDPEAGVLIANLVKCRPPANRVPHPAEVAACFPYLRRQIQLARPHTVLLLGATALRHFADPPGSAVLGDMVDRRFSLKAWPGIDFRVLYHPAYLLRSHARRPGALAQLRRIRRATAARRAPVARR